MNPAPASNVASAPAMTTFEPFRIVVLQPLAGRRWREPRRLPAAPAA